MLNINWPTQPYETIADHINLNELQDNLIKHPIETADLLQQLTNTAGNNINPSLIFYRVNMIMRESKKKDTL